MVNIRLEITVASKHLREKERGGEVMVTESMSDVRKIVVSDSAFRAAVPVLLPECNCSLFNKFSYVGPGGKLERDREIRGGRLLGKGVC